MFYCGERQSLSLLDQGVSAGVLLEENNQLLAGLLFSSSSRQIELSNESLDDHPVKRGAVCDDDDDDRHSRRSFGINLNGSLSSALDYDSDWS